jgi:hypothetical protein
LKFGEEVAQRMLRIIDLAQAKPDCCLRELVAATSAAQASAPLFLAAPFSANGLADADVAASCRFKPQLLEVIEEHGLAPISAHPDFRCWLSLPVLAKLQRR